jgi:hypothetical protein
MTRLAKGIRAGYEGVAGMGISARCGVCGSKTNRLEAHHYGSLGVIAAELPHARP